MILSDRDILAEISSGRIVIDPFDEAMINPASLDYKLGPDFYEVRAVDKSPEFINVIDGDEGCIPLKANRTPRPVLDPKDASTFKLTKIPPCEDGSIVMAPLSFVIASSLEKITLPDDIAVYGVGKSSLGRLGIQNSASFAGFADPKFSGTMVLELLNCSGNYIKLTPGMKIGQWLFMKMISPANKGYDKTGRYQNQGPGTGSKGI